MTIKETLNAATQKLKANGVEEPRRDAVVLLSFVLNKDKTFLFAHDKDFLEEETLEKFFSVVERRAAHEPLQYITGKQEFFNLEFEVTKDVLIPRPETEILVETALGILDSKFKIQNSKEEIRWSQSAIRNLSVCDVGTGSGCIVVSLLHERFFLRGVGLDISKNALTIAERNAKRHVVDERLTLIESDCFSALQNLNTLSDGRVFVFDLIVSNPPYINEQDFQTLQSEVKDYEPRQALTPGGDGLSVIRRLIKDAPRFLKEEGYLIFEIGYDQSNAVKELVDEKVWTLIEIRKDLQGTRRTVVLKLV